MPSKQTAKLVIVCDLQYLNVLGTNAVPIKIIFPPLNSIFAQIHCCQFWFRRHCYR
ncbi:hypothetical protein CRG95_00755 [Escherichia sp. E4208]|nr:hypothetical protein CRT22_22770 [Escherichia sp. E5028]TGB88212.1 hypothetical protein CRG95_00755 [Escherichia sp. E4208]